MVGTKAFIYFLEALAATFAPMMLQDLLPERYLSSAGNGAPKFALIRGYSKQKRVNHFDAAF